MAEAIKDYFEKHPGFLKWISKGLVFAIHHSHEHEPKAPEPSMRLAYNIVDAVEGALLNDLGMRHEWRSMTPAHREECRRQSAKAVRIVLEDAQ